MPLPSNLSYGQVVGKFLLAQGDGSDPDALPDGIAASGTITFTPSVSRITDTSATPPAVIWPKAISCTIDTDGLLRDPQGTAGVYLIATDDPDTNPTGWTYRVKIVLDGIREPLQFDMQVPAGATIDLAQAIPVSASDGVITLAGPKGDPGPTGAAGRGISSIARTAGTGAAGTTDTFTITYTDATTATFTVVNGANGATGATGRGVSTITRTSGTGAAGTADTYTITYSDATTSTFTVLNGANGSNGSNGRGISSVARTSGTGAPGTTDTYTITFTDATTSTFTVTNGANGSGSVSSVNGYTGPAIVLTAADVSAKPSSYVPTWTEITGKPTLGTASSKNVPASGNAASGEAVLGSDTRLTDARTPTTHTHTKSQITDLGTIGTAAAKDTGTISGTVPVLGTGGRLAMAQMASGTPDGTKFIRDDGTLATPSSGGGGGLLATLTRTAASATAYACSSVTSVDMDATNLALTFTPTTTKALIVLSGHAQGNATSYYMWSLRNGSTNVPNSSVVVSADTESKISNRVARILVTGLTPGTPVTLKWAHRVGAGSANTYYDDGNSFATSTACMGPLMMEAWVA